MQPLQLQSHPNASTNFGLNAAFTSSHQPKYITQEVLRMSGEEEMSNWKQFQGTELGSLMSQIYGNQSKPKVNYPKLNTKKAEPPKQFIPGGANPHAEDPRKVSRKVVNIAVPTNFKAKREPVKAIDVINRRRSAESIQAEMDEIKLRQIHFRPAYVQPSGDAEKERLNQIFQYKGGKGLPKDLTHPEGVMPLEIAAQRKEMERMDAVRNKRGHALPKPPPQNGRFSRAPISEKEQFADHISREIEERREHLQEMKELGMIKPEKERQLKNEIAQKIQELEAII